MSMLLGSFSGLCTTLWDALRCPHALCPLTPPALAPLSFYVSSLCVCCLSNPPQSPQWLAGIATHASATAVAMPAGRNAPPHKLHNTVPWSGAFNALSSGKPEVLPVFEATYTDQH
jgi:hypothetical protein